MNDQAKGLALVATGVLILSPDAALIRLIQADTWTLLAWRGFGGAAVLALLSGLRHRRRLVRHIRSAGPLGLAIAVLYSLCQMAFVTGVETTNPANVLVLVAATPIFAALFSRFLLGERLDRTTVIAIPLGLAGVLITLSGSLTGLGRWQGDLVALAVPVTLALAFTLTRRMRMPDIWPVFALAGLMTGTASVVMAPTLAVAPDDLPLVLALVLVVAPLSFALISLGPRFIPAAEVSLLMLLETLLGPVWVWLLAGHPPTPQAVVGGALLLGTLAWHSARRLADTRRTQPHRAAG